jgi:hypothetical protein
MRKLGDKPAAISQERNGSSREWIFNQKKSKDKLDQLVGIYCMSIDQSLVEAEKPMSLEQREINRVFLRLLRRSSGKRTKSVRRRVVSCQHFPS